MLTRLMVLPFSLLLSSPSLLSISPLYLSSPSLLILSSLSSPSLLLLSYPMSFRLSSPHVSHLSFSYSYLYIAKEEEDEEEVHQLKRVKQQRNFYQK